MRSSGPNFYIDYMKGCPSCRISFILQRGQKCFIFMLVSSDFRPAAPSFVQCVYHTVGIPLYLNLVHGSRDCPLDPSQPRLQFNTKGSVLFVSRIMCPQR